MNLLRILPLCIVVFPLWSQPISDLQFIQNKNQWPEEIDFQAQVPGGRVAVSAVGFSVFLIDKEKLELEHFNRQENYNESNGLPVEEPTRGHFFQINLLGANLQAKANPALQLPTTV